jgi:hypothetical protein
MPRFSGESREMNNPIDRALETAADTMGKLPKNLLEFAKDGIDFVRKTFLEQ